MVEYPAIGELQWPLSTHNTSRSASQHSRAAGSSISARYCRVCQSWTAHSTATMPCPTAGNISDGVTARKRCGRPSPTRSSPERAMISASAGPASPPSGSRCILAIVELADARIGGAAKMDHFDLRKQPPRIGGAPHGIGADVVTLAARTLDVFDASDPCRSTSASVGGSRASVAPITRPGVSSLPGMSFSECIAA